MTDPAGGLRDRDELHPEVDRATLEVGDVEATGRALLCLVEQWNPFGLRTAGRRVEAWLQRGLPSS